MRVVLQRVKKALVTVEDKEISSIGKGFLLLAGFGREDTPETAAAMAQKICRLRVFEDENGKMNRDIGQVQGEILSVSQFTLLGNTDKGNRPGFDAACEPAKARSLWESFNDRIRETGMHVAEGIFGAHMEINLINDGPVTLVLDR